MFEPGQSGNPAGRKKGTINKNTKQIREAYQKLTEDNLDNMNRWLMQTAQEDPAKALDLMLKLSEYIIPKLARQEIVGNEGEDLFKNIKFSFGPDINNREDRLEE
jgi:molecular chaperone DnaK (HSP70)|tara:strand:- start:2301 stop:2615 length:315 start_codon:yes stop_codon:yes gene_type:complete